MLPSIRIVLDKKAGLLKLYYHDRVEYYHLPPRTPLSKVLSGEIVLVQDLTKKTE